AGQTISATVTAQGQLSTAEEFGNIILVSNTDGSNVYLKDVAKVSLGMQDYSTSTRLNGVNTTGMAVMLSNSGNALATATAVKEKMAVLQ
ncbi:efflux RND transporter permease subunit, partial [Klebsiella pneumoniae]|nr:efflux RND transporter permease subunit [Klebsiella pneumoniae]